MYMQFKRTPDNNTLWTLRTANTDDVRTIYFALRAYRDNLHDQLVNTITKNLDEEDYTVSSDAEVKHYENGQCVEVFHLQDYDLDGAFVVTPDVPQVKPTVLMNSCTEYEDLMFLHETLSKVNTALFEITQNYDTTT